MYSLFINTSKPNVVVALMKDGKVVARQEWPADRDLKKALLEVINTLMERYQLTSQDINRIAVHGGPGHFGGVRAGVTVASTLAFAWQKDLISLSGDNEEAMMRRIPDATAVAAIKPNYE